MKHVTLLILASILFASCGVDKSELKVVPMASPANSPSAEPFLFSDDKNQVYLSWIEKSGDTSTLKFSKLNEAAWSKPELIVSGSNLLANWADYPMIARNQEQLLSHFLRRNGEEHLAYEVVLTASNNHGKTWSEPHAVHDDGTHTEHGFVSMIPYQDGFFVAWLDGRNTAMEETEAAKGHEGHHGQMSLRAAILDKDLKKLNEWELDNRTCDCCQTAAVITNQGPVVVYRDRSEDEIRDMSITRLVDGKWTAPQPIHTDGWKIAGCPVNGPRLAARGDKVAVAWYTLAQDSARVYAAFSDNGGATFGKPIQIDEGNPIGRVDVVMIDDSNIMVSWMERSAIKVVKVNADGTKGSSAIVAASSESRSSGFPQMAQSGNRLIFAWTDDSEKNIKTASLEIK